MHNQFACGRRFRLLNIVDDVTRECLAAIPDTSISGRRVARELTELIAHRGKPRMVVSDHGTEFTSNAVLACVEGSRDRMALHRARQADAEWLCGIPSTVASATSS
ncbi:DDE-type integrase/transposase/recombinase [Mesorhizobium sp. M0601]|uniref:DDE-type integrase/transposase/recombinase n=1 Tax=Mesorhizobium sp. M0601 TaxID=2956969 RepID=UPI00333A090A